MTFHHRLLLLHLLLLFQPAHCSHPWDEISFHPGGKPKPPTPLILLPQKHITNTNNHDDTTILHPYSPAALDGSPYGLYFSPSKSGSTKWTISIDGGGWCYDENYCHERSHGSLGSSHRALPKQFCQCLNTNTNHTDYDHDCNCIRLPYLDGASFSGYRSEPVLINNKTIYFRGIINLDAAIDFALERGLGQNGTEFVLTGGSAGGLATFLHVDRVAERIRKYRSHLFEDGSKITKRVSRRTRTTRMINDSDIKIRAVPVAGYFLDHDNIDHSSNGGPPNTPEFEYTNYSTRIRHIYYMQNLTFGNGLMPQCQHFFPDTPWSCFMSPHMQQFIQTPFFMFNSMYDLWQLEHVLQLPVYAKVGKRHVWRYGKSFLEELERVYQGKGRRNGGFITSCVCHSCPWSNLILDGKIYDEYYFRWMKEIDDDDDDDDGQKVHDSMMYIDSRLPNGNGTLVGPGLERCQKYPRSSDVVGDVSWLKAVISRFQK